jgi:hypothetical protein
MYGHGLTVLVSQRLQRPDSPPVESERWWLEMARREEGASREPGRRVDARRGLRRVFRSRPGRGPDVGRS